MALHSLLRFGECAFGSQRRVTTPNCPWAIINNSRCWSLLRGTRQETSRIVGIFQIKSPLIVSDSYCFRTDVTTGVYLIIVGRKKLWDQPNRNHPSLSWPETLVREKILKKKEWVSLSPFSSLCSLPVVYVRSPISMGNQNMMVSALSWTRKIWVVDGDVHVITKPL